MKHLLLYIILSLTVLSCDWDPNEKCTNEAMESGIIQDRITTLDHLTITDKEYLEVVLSPQRYDIKNGEVTKIHETKLNILEFTGTTLSDLPMAKGEKKNYPISQDTNASYFTVEEVSSGEKTLLPPLKRQDFVSYVGWNPDKPHQLFFQSHTSNYFEWLWVDFSSAPFSALLTRPEDQVIEPTVLSNTYPAYSPDGLFFATNVVENRTWTGTASITVVEKSTLEYKVALDITLSSGSNQLTHQSNILFRSHDRYCTTTDSF